MKKVLVSAIFSCLLIITSSSTIYSQNQFAGYTFTDDEVINLARLIYDTSLLDDTVVLSNGQILKRDSKCGFGLMQALDWALQNQIISPDAFRQIEEIRSTDDLDKTYNTTNFTIDYNDSPGDPDCVFEATNTHPTVQNTQGEPVPMYIYNLGEYLENARYVFTTYGFEEPGSIGLLNVDVYDMPAFGQTSPLGSLDIDNDMVGCIDSWMDSYLNITVSHELFHKVQFEYVDSLDPDSWAGWIMEGTTPWAEDAVCDDGNDYVNYAEVLFDNPDQTLTEGQMSDGYYRVHYYKFLTEWLGQVTTEPEVGIDLMLALWNEWDSILSNGTSAVDNVLQNWASTSFDFSFKEWLLTNYLKDLYNPFTEYDYIEDEDCLHLIWGWWNEENGYPMIEPVEIETLDPDATFSYSNETVNEWAADYLEFEIGDGVETIDIDMTNLDGDILWQVCCIQGNTCPLIYESELTTYSLNITNDSYDKITIIVGGMDEAGIYDIAISAAGTIPPPPTLTSGTVTPNIGLPSDIFDFSVTYTCPENLPPEGDISVVIDGDDHTMEAQGSAWSSGVEYTYQSTVNQFSEGTYEFHFEGTQGTNQLRFPETGELDFTVTLTPPPPAISDLTITISGSDAILDWTEVPDAESYNIYRSTEPYFSTVGNLLTVIDNPPYTDDNALNGDSYFYFVTYEEEESIPPTLEAYELSPTYPQVQQGASFTARYQVNNPNSFAIDILLDARWRNESGVYGELDPVTYEVTLQPGLQWVERPATVTSAMDPGVYAFAWYLLDTDNSVITSSEYIDDSFVVVTGGAIIEQDFELGNTGVYITMVWIPPGSFMQGAYEGEVGAFSSEYPQHLVTLDYGFWLGKYEVTQEQWVAIVGSNPSHSYGVGDNYPVYYVSWYNVHNTFLPALNSQTVGEPWSLPSESEWEYAIRAGTETRYYWGDDLNYTEIVDYAWYDGSGGLSHEVGLKLPNAWGLYDMSGNVWEWVEDYWHSNYNGAPTNGSAWLSPTSSYRVLRGGSWYNPPSGCRSADRDGGDPSAAYGSYGFRLRRSP